MAEGIKGSGKMAVVEDHSGDRTSVSRQSIRIKLPEATMLLISGTARWDGDGHIVHKDFRAQIWQTFQNLTALLEAEGATWDKVVRTTCHLRDLKQDCRNFNEVRARFYKEAGLGSRPANTCIQSRIQPQDLLVEVEVIAILPHERTS